MAKNKIINKLNQRLRKIKSVFGEDATYLEIINNLANIEDIKLTSKGYISYKTTSNITIAAAESNVPTISELLEDIKSDPDYVMSNEKISKDMLVELSNLRAALTGSYSTLLAKLYNVRDKLPADEKEFQIYSQLENFIRWNGETKNEENLNKRREAIEKFITSIDEIDNYETEDYLSYIGVY